MGLQLRQRYNINLVLIKRGENARTRKDEKESIINFPMPDTVVCVDDILMVPVPTPIWPSFPRSSGFSAIR